MLQPAVPTDPHRAQPPAEVVTDGAADVPPGIPSAGALPIDQPDRRGIGVAENIVGFHVAVDDAVVPPTRSQLAHVVEEVAVLDPDGEFPRVPGYVFNVPDSLRADFVRIRQGTEPILDRVESNADCGGDLTAPERRRADGTLVCMGNFIKAPTRTTLSRRSRFPSRSFNTPNVSSGERIAAAVSSESASPTTLTMRV